MSKGTEREQQILDFIISFSKEKGYSPSVREIAAAVGLSSPSTVQTYLTKLQNKGLLRKESSRNRTIFVEDTETIDDAPEFLNVPVLGEIAAGLPIPAQTDIIRNFPLPMDFAKNRDVFMLRIKGDSMINVGIYDRDYVVIESRPDAVNGDIVAALLEDGATVKTFYKENGHFRLQPENDALDPIIVDEVCILGKVVGVFRLF
ncbi:MAG: transcriptional repressor LexA [Clostridia bacterium]|nr:transcriptional repressor LexA [Clostridia bacterium]